MTSCIVHASTPKGSSEGRQWFDDRGLLIRADSSLGPTTYDIAYDDQQRIVSIMGDGHSHEWSYAPDRVTYVFDHARTTIEDLVAGRVVHVEGDQEADPDQRYMTDYTYDSAGRVLTVSKGAPGAIPSSVAFTYDDEGRLASAHDSSEHDAKLTYAETASALAVEVVNPDPTGDPLGDRREHWQIDFDDMHRVVDAAIITDGSELSTSYVYGEGSITVTTSFGSTFVATGTCELPRVVLAPPAPLPIVFWLGLTRIPEPLWATVESGGYFF